MRNKKGSMSISAAIKVITAVLCGALILTGTYGIVSKVSPKTKDKFVSAFNYSSEGTQAASGNIGDNIVSSNVVEYHQCPEAVRNYLNNVTYNPNDYSTSSIETYTPSTVLNSDYKPVIDSAYGKTYINAIPNTVNTVKVNGEDVQIKPIDRLRWIDSNAGNIRDLGGWDCDGGTVKYGMLIRGTEISSEDADVLVNQCGVDCELNLRGSEAYWTVSPLGNNVEYIHQSGSYYKRAVDLSGNEYVLTKNIILTIFNCVKSQKTVYFHCYQGKDRTGTISGLILGILGVSQSDCDKDYELTSFATAYDARNHCSRSYYADPLSWNAMIQYINTMEGDNFAEKVCSWMIKVGISIDDINEFRSNMINGSPSILIDKTK